ncbi:MAG: hypothetical protein IPI35_18260 [Deltaproteobacteria bacterium]|nr:hypothetical protein [Deltaproteobacteria bacterium]
MSRQTNGHIDEAVKPEDVSRDDQARAHQRDVLPRRLGERL